MSHKFNKIPKIHGHRGARGLFPENTLVAVEAGINAGCYGIEVDLCVTRDDQLVVLHDPRLFPYKVRDPKGNWIKDPITVRELSLNELKEFDVGRLNQNSEYGQKFRSQRFMDRTQIPTLDEHISLVNSLNPEIIFNLELKSTPYQPSVTPKADHYINLVTETIQQQKSIERFFLQSFDWRLVLGAKEIIPELKIGFLTDLQFDGNPVSPIPGEPTLWTDNHDLMDYENQIPLMIKSLGGDVWSSNHLDLTAEDVQSAHNIGLEVYVWTVNEIADFKRMIEISVDVITTDYPDRLYDFLNS